MFYNTIGHAGRINRLFGDGSAATKDFSDTTLFQSDAYMGGVTWFDFMDR